MAGGRKHLDLVNKTFGNLKVLSYEGNSKWLCECKCGQRKIIRTGDLTGNKTQSCGCLKHSVSIKRFYKHGHQKERVYKIWQGMKTRCYNPNRKYYNRYGGRGIKVCQEWLDDFMNFYNWAMNNGYNDKLSIDRINVNGNYEPNNCRWVNKKIQARNTSANKFYTYNNETHCLAEWAEILNVSLKVLRHRIKHNLFETIYKKI